MKLRSTCILSLLCALPSLALAQPIYEAPTPEPSDGPAPGAVVMAAPSVDYPAGTDYDSAVATLGLDNETRCSANLEGVIFITKSTAEAIQVAAQAACDVAAANPDTPGAQVAACATLAGVSAAAVAAQIASEQCGLQDALVDSAEVEATFEQSLLLLEGANRLDVRTVIIDERTHSMDIRAHLRDERDIESHLLACDRIASLMLPAAADGMNEKVFALMAHRLDQAQAAGANRNFMTQARNAYNRADAKRTSQQRYDEAWTELCRSYDFLSKATYN